MSGRKGSGNKGANRSRTSTTPPTRRPDVIIIQPRQQPGVLGQIAGTAAGVAAGTVIGDKITGRNDPPAQAPPVLEQTRPCQYEEQQLIHCVQSQTNLQDCEPLKQTMLDCKRRYNLR